MQCSKSLGYLAYPLLILSFFAVPSLWAQTTDTPQSAPAQSPDQTQSPAPAAPEATPPLNPGPGQAPPLTRDPQAQAQQQGGASSSQPQTNYPNEQDRIRLAREAQARVRARREQRTQAAIQDTYSHKYEIYFGYAYLHIRPGHFLQHANENGWNVGFTRMFSQKLGVSADLRGYYKNVYVGNVRYQIPDGTDPTTGAPLFTSVQGMYQPFISNYSIMVGPQYYVRRRKNYAIGAQVLAGATYNLFDANSTGLPGRYVGLYDNGTRFTAAAAVPVDINLGPGLAFRIAPDYNLTTWKYDFGLTTGHIAGTDLQHNLGFTMVLNYRFGRQ